MTKLATLCYHEETSTWSAQYEGETLVAAIGAEPARKYVIKRIRAGQSVRALALGVSDFDNVPATEAKRRVVGQRAECFAPAPGIPGLRIKPNNLLPVAERYELLDEMVDLVIKNIGIRSLIITGDGSLGKTFHTKERIKAAGMKSTEEAQKIAYSLTDEEQEVADMILARMDQCKKLAEQYYKENPVVAPDDEDDEPEGVELHFGKVIFTSLHTSQDIKERVIGARFHHLLNNQYEFNIKLAVKNPQEYFDVIVPHEMAHHVQHVVYPDAKRVKAGHGKEWCKIMTTVFGIPAERYHSMDTADMMAAPELEGDYHYVKGYTSAKGLYRTLFENRKKLIVLDDADAAWKNDVGANILKAALDSDEDRWISWNVEGGDNNGLPKRFLFEGRIIFISNVSSEDFPQPLITRSLRADVELTTEECFERMRQILPSPKFAPGVTMKVKKMAYNFLYENREMAAEISSRSLLNVIQVANSGSKLWKRIALANIA